MNFEPININIKDSRRFAEVAFVIDSPHFVKRAREIRGRYGINKPIGKEDVQQWVLANISKEKTQALFEEITALRISLSCDSHYQTVFEKAVLGGNIQDIDYKNTILINFAKLPSFLTYLPTQAFGILLTPQTSENNIKSAYKKYRQILQEFQSSPDTFSLRDNKISDREKIDRDRKWYWKKEKGIKYRQIAKESGIDDESFYTQYKDVIREAIKSYKEMLG